MLNLGAAYFAFYAPYSALANTLSRGLLPGIAKPSSGWQILPAAALGTIAGVTLFLALSGWWRHARLRELPGREILLASLFHALIIGATTLNYSFPGVSILFVLLLMRGGVLILSPLVDTLRQHDVQPASWVALGLSLAAVAVALADVDNYVLPIGAVLSLSAYFLGYVGRFQIMAQEAKAQGLEANRRYFVEEQLLSAPILLLGLTAGAALGPGAQGEMLRSGFTSFLGTEAALIAFVVGMLYAGLSAAGSLIYVDPREYTYCVPVNRGASLFAGIVASYVLTFTLGLNPPSPLQLTAAGLVMVALVVLARPDWIVGRIIPSAGARRLFLFVCSGNTCRSPMATAIARAELAARFGRRLPIRVQSAGLTVQPGTPMTPEAQVALREIAVEPGRHRSRLLSPELVERAEAIYCMTAAHREAVLRMHPEAAGKTWCIDPDGDIPDPIGSALEVYVSCAERLRTLVRHRLDALLAEA
jgi:protein-tyrosine-phosphatase